MNYGGKNRGTRLISAPHIRDSHLLLSPRASKVQRTKKNDRFPAKKWHLLYKQGVCAGLPRRVRPPEEPPVRPDRWGLISLLRVPFPESRGNWGSRAQSLMKVKAFL